MTAESWAEVPWPDPPFAEEDALAAEAFSAEQVQLRHRAQAIAFRDSIPKAPDPWLEAIPKAPELPPDQAAALDHSLRTGEPLVVRRGLGFHVVADPVDITISRLRWSRGECTGYVVVQHRGRHVDHGTLNLTSSTARAARAKLLSDKVAGSAVPWRDLLETLTYQVLQAREQAQPFEVVGRRPVAMTSATYRLAPLVPDGLPVSIFAPGGTGKTTLAAVLAVSVSAGITLVPGLEPRQGGVLILDFENDVETWNALIAAVAAGAGIEAPEVAYRHCGMRSVADQVDEIAEFVQAHDIDLVVVDAVSGALGQTSEGGTAEETTKRMFAALREIGAATILLDHVAGADLDSERPATKMYGSVYKMNDSRRVYALRRESTSPDGLLHLALIETKTNGKPIPPLGLRLEFDGQEPPRSIIVSREEIATPELVAAAVRGIDRVERYLVDHGRSDAADIADGTGMAPNVVRAFLSRGSKSGRFTKLPDHRWVAVSDR